MKDEKPQNPAIGLEDVKNIRNFFKHFNVTWPDELEKASKAFEEHQSVDNEKLLKIAISRAIVTVDHPAFKDKMFEGIYKESEDVTYRAQFDKDLEEELSEEQKAEKNKA